MSARKFDPYTRSFYLVQRIKRNPRADVPASANASPLAKLRNPFGYGTLGDYDLDYMGAAEFEWGAIPEAFNRLQKAGRGLVMETKTYGGHDLDFLWIRKEGDPFEGWCDWAEAERPFYGKERPYDLEQRLNDEQPPEWGWRTDVWWALSENVLWAFTEDGHLERMLESMRGATARLRGAPKVA